MLQQQPSILSKLRPVSFNPYAYAIKPINVWRKIVLGFIAMHKIEIAILNLDEKNLPFGTFLFEK